MVSAKILVVEDETIVARDIQQSLTRLGYDVPTTATSGEEAIRKTREIDPDLILMDIVLKGPMDGVETVRHINRQFDVPVIYLTAYADDSTLDRAKATSPAGYMLKPFHPNELRPTIELALHRAQINRHLKESLRWLTTTVRCMSDAMITTNRGGRLTYMSQAAQALTGWLQQDATGADLTTMFSFEEDGPVQVDSLAYADPKDKSIIGIEIHSGRNRIVRRIFEHLGYDVKGLDRVMYAGLTKKNVERSKWRYLSEKEIRLLKYMNESKKKNSKTTETATTVTENNLAEPAIKDWKKLSDKDIAVAIGEASIPVTNKPVREKKVPQPRKFKTHSEKKQFKNQQVGKK